MSAKPYRRKPPRPAYAKRYHSEGILIAIDGLVEVLTMGCQQKVIRPPGFGGMWEGYGPTLQWKTGPECAREIRLAWLEMRAQMQNELNEQPKGKT